MGVEAKTTAASLIDAKAQGLQIGIPTTDEAP